MGTKSSKRENILIFFPCLICALMTAKKQRREFQKIQGGGGEIFLGGHNKYHCLRVKKRWQYFV